MRPENILKPLTLKCRKGKCLHIKCTCGHCSQYHYARTEECLQLSIDLKTCPCKAFRTEKINHKEVR